MKENRSREIKNHEQKIENNCIDILITLPYITPVAVDAAQTKEFHKGRLDGN